MTMQHPVLTPTGWVLLYAVFLSLICALLMFWDKLCAVKGKRRVPELTLLSYAFLGGAFGAKLGQRLYRHKTRKEPFRTWLNRWVLANVIMYFVLLTPSLRELVLSFLSEFLSRFAA